MLISADPLAAISSNASSLIAGLAGDTPLQSKHSSRRNSYCDTVRLDILDDAGSRPRRWSSSTASSTPSVIRASPIASCVPDFLPKSLQTLVTANHNARVKRLQRSSPQPQPALVVNRKKKKKKKKKRNGGGAAFDLKILVSDDNKINLMLITRRLSKLGFDADVANDGVEALEMFAETQYDLVLTDMQMPRMDGLEFTRQARKMLAAAPNRKLRGRVVILGVSANISDEDVRDMKASGMDATIEKPIDHHLLETQINKWGNIIVKSKKAQGRGISAHSLMQEHKERQATPKSQLARHLLVIAEE
jgi:CheY-like chemotaxis protein